MIILPWKADVPFERDPVTNWLLVASVVAVFGLEMSWAMHHPYIFSDVDPEATQAVYEPTPFDPYVLSGFSNLRGLFGHMWLHANFLHIFGNMLFLWIFGNAVCQKIGNGLYLPAYLLAGLAAAGAHLLFSEEQAIGASGAINGVVGMYLVFYPLNEITCLFSLFPLVPLVYAWGFRSVTVSGVWVILLWLAFDIYGALAGGGPVAYMAHLGGFAAGFGIGVALLMLKWVKMRPYERSLLQIIRKQTPGVYPAPPPPTPWRADGEYVEEEMDMQMHVRPVKLGDLLKSGNPSCKPDQPESGQTIQFTCPCGQRIKAPIENAGSRGLCPGCKQEITVPFSSAES